MWTHFVCKASVNKTRTYLKRSKSSPINVWLGRGDDLSHSDPFFQIIPHAIGRLKSLSIAVTWGSLQDITAHLSHPAPLLGKLEIDGGPSGSSGFAPLRYPEPTTALFNGDLHLLHEFRLTFVRTELPWRNMAALTSFALSHMPPDSISIPQLLDFFESAPRLREIELDVATPTSGAQNGRLVSLACLKRMDILRGEASSLLLDHLSIPVGAELRILADSFDRIVEDHLPRSLDNLRNLSNLTKISLHASGPYPRVQFSGPTGKFRMTASETDKPWSALELLIRLDASKIEELEIIYDGPLPSHPTYQALLPMRNLRILTLSDHQTPHLPEHILNPNKSPSKIVILPKLEEFSFIPYTYMEVFDIGTVIEMAAARASRGAELRTVRIVDKVWELDPEDASELRKHVLHVEYSPDLVNNRSEDSGDKRQRSVRFW